MFFTPPLITRGEPLQHFYWPLKNLPNLWKSSYSGEASGRREEFISGCRRCQVLPLGSCWIRLGRHNSIKSFLTTERGGSSRGAMPTFKTNLLIRLSFLFFTRNNQYQKFFNTNLLDFFRNFCWVYYLITKTSK